MDRLAQVLIGCRGAFLSIGPSKQITPNSARACTSARQEEALFAALNQQLSTIRSTAELVLDEYEKVQSIRAQTEAAIATSTCRTTSKASIKPLFNLFRTGFEGFGWRHAQGLENV